MRSRCIGVFATGISGGFVSLFIADDDYLWGHDLISGLCTWATKWWLVKPKLKICIEMFCRVGVIGIWVLGDD